MPLVQGKYHGVVCVKLYPHKLHMKTNVSGNSIVRRDEQQFSRGSSRVFPATTWRCQELNWTKGFLPAKSVLCPWAMAPSNAKWKATFCFVLLETFREISFVLIIWKGGEPFFQTMSIVWQRKRHAAVLCAAHTCPSCATSAAQQLVSLMKMCWLILQQNSTLSIPFPYYLKFCLLSFCSPCEN